MDLFRADIRDLRALHRLEHACFPKDAWPLLDLIAVLLWPGVIRLKVMSNGRMVGFIAGDPRPSDDLAWISTIAVMPEYQRKGLGRLMLEECEKHLPQRRIRLCVRVSNEPAIHLYLREGYRTIQTWKEYYNDKESAFLMEKIRAAGVQPAQGS